MLDGLEPQPNRFLRIVKDGPGRNGRFASTLLTVVHLASRPPGLHGLILLLLSDVFPGGFFVSHAPTLTEVAVCPETIPPKGFLFYRSNYRIDTERNIPAPGSGEEFSRKNQLTTMFGDHRKCERTWHVQIIRSFFMTGQENDFTCEGGYCCQI